MNRPRCDETAAWVQLQQRFRTAGASFDLKQAFAQDADRFAQFSVQAPHVFADLSKNLVDAPTRHAEVAASLHNLGLLFLDQGKRPEAEAVFREALAMRRKLLGKSLKAAVTRRNASRPENGDPH